VLFFLFSLTLVLHAFLPRDALSCDRMSSVCPSVAVRPSVTLVDCDIT